MHLQLAGMGFFHHRRQLHVTRRRAFRHQHMVVRANAVSVLRDLRHRPRFEHPVIAVVHPLAVGLPLLGLIPVGIGDKLHQIEIHPHFRLQLLLDALELVGVKALQINLILLAGIAIFLQHVQRAGGNVLAFLMVEPRRFDLRVDADVFAGRMVQPLHKLNLLFKGMNTEIRFTHRETARISLHVLAIFRLKPFGKLQRLYLGEGKVDGVEAAILTRPLREALGHVGHPIQIVVMQHHQPVVFRHHQVLLEVVRPLRVGHRFRRQGMFRQIAAGAAVGDNDFFPRDGAERERRRGQQHSAHQGG